MPASVTPPSDKDVHRKRRAHTKSRRGCGNCKLRRIKCDEAKPRCKKCLEYGVACNYGPAGGVSTGELVLSFGGVSHIEPPRKAAVSTNQTMMDMINYSLRQSPTSAQGVALVYQLDMDDMQLLDKFHSRTVLSIGTDKTRSLYQAESFRLACMHPFLMHLVLGFTIMHDRSLSPKTKRQTHSELYHWYYGTAIFNSKIPAPLTRSEKDAMWISSTILGAGSIGSIDATDAEECWPLKDRPSTEPDWLTMSEGKNEIYQLADLASSESGLKQLVDVCVDDFFSSTSKGAFLRYLPQELVEVLGLTDPSSYATSPYYVSADILSRLMPFEYTESTLLKFITFLSHMTPEFKNLFNARDPGALLLMAYWFAKACSYQLWWSWRRTVLECQAICLYLERNHGDLPHLEKILRFPKSRIGLATC
ncbi:putative transcription factor cys6 protein [Phaeoacremonium minimum UCRPA7]|uniref:Putative transcription factor cys6 protein n=1 Tax=Phaeoacremonium minimum (strain UCR-PA7) TaxID=1286976 RepID=R8BWT9_PHAM7|nr:putative transcription factor cys6 protein [Phaeoacremonium minimum UCRPA7]EOO03807.1 putative transcription factor cys6 protein [Phaeoacremonium minimum UCRPA7]